MSACISTPISWLLLERFFGNDLPDAERTRVEEHLAKCTTCSFCAKRIREDAERPLRPLRPLGAARTVESAPLSMPAPKTKRPSRLSWLPIAGSLAAAAVVLLIVRERKPKDDSTHGTFTRTKGGDVAFTLVRDDGSPFAEDVVPFRAAGDRFRVRVTCPVNAIDTADLVVFADGTAAFPVPAQRVACGNEVDLDGAFRVDGTSDMRVCFVWNDPPMPVDRARVQDQGESAASHSLCKTLRVAR